MSLIDCPLGVGGLNARPKHVLVGSDMCGMFVRADVSLIDGPWGHHERSMGMEMNMLEGFWALLT